MPYKVTGVFPIEKGPPKPIGEPTTALVDAINAARDKKHRLRGDTLDYAIFSCSKRRKKPFATWSVPEGATITTRALCPDCKTELEVWL